VSPLLIIGATSSVASDVARIYARRGEQLVLVGRNEEKLRGLTEELGTSVVATRCFDFTEHRKVESVVRSLHEEHGAFRLALIAHGYLGDQQLSEKKFDEAYEQIAVNYLSAVAWLIPLANEMEERGTGHLAAITSVAGDRGRPRNYTYGSTKGALALYLQGLRSRLYPQVRVTTIKLGPVDTAMTVGHEKNATFISSQQAAQGIVRSIERGQGEAYVPGYWRPILWMVRNMPEFIFQRLGFLSGR
jgi:short-subunit dehydrogenase